MGMDLKGIHHSAFRCRDAEETRAFYEDVLGLPVAAALAFEEEPGSGKAHPYVHIFFRMPDGNYIAFFDAPRESMQRSNFTRKRWWRDHKRDSINSEEVNCHLSRSSSVIVKTAGGVPLQWIESVCSQTVDECLESLETCHQKLNSRSGFPLCSC